MAKKRRTATQTKIIRVGAPRAAAPIIRLSAPRAAPKKHHRRKGGGGGTALTGKSVVGVIIGGALLGWIEKNYGARLPSVPLLGVKGTIAAGAYFAHKQGMAREITRDLCIAAAATSGYQLGKEGKVSGDVEGDDIVGAVAAQV